MSKKTIQKPCKIQKLCVMITRLYATTSMSLLLLLTHINTHPTINSSPSAEPTVSTHTYTAIIDSGAALPHDTIPATTQNAVQNTTHDIVQHTLDTIHDTTYDTTHGTMQNNVQETAHSNKTNKTPVQPITSVTEKEINETQVSSDTPDNSPQKDNRSVSTEPFLIDTIVAVVMTDEGTEIVTLSYTKRPSLSGAPRTLEDIVFELLVFLDATKHKITPDNDAVDKYLETVQKENNLTRQQLEDIFAQSGYTFEEALKEFKKMQANNIMLEYKIKSNLVVPRKKIEKYFEENPETLEACYELEYAIIPFKSGISKKEQLSIFIDTLSTAPEKCAIAWGSPFWLNKSEIAQEKYYLTDLPIGGISTPRETENGFEIYRLKNKNDERLKTIEERYTEIANILRRPRYAKLIDEYKEQLFSTSSVQYF